MDNVIGVIFAGHRRAMIRFRAAPQSQRRCPTAVLSRRRSAPMESLPDTALLVFALKSQHHLLCCDEHAHSRRPEPGVPGNYRQGGE